MTIPYRLQPTAVSPDFRAFVLNAYPALQSHRDAPVYRRMMEHVLFATDRDHATRQTILSAAAVAAMVGVHPSNKQFCALKWMEAFSRDVLPLRPSDYQYTQGRARTISPLVQDDVLEALRRECTAKCEDKDKTHEKVWFADGRPVTRRSRESILEAHEDYLVAEARSIPPDHPAAALMAYLTEQPQGALSRAINTNSLYLSQAIADMPTGTPHEQARKDWCLRVAARLQDFPKIYYKAVAGTPRLFSSGTTLNQLPREMRHIILAGEYECDLQACQLAVVARLWDIPELQAFLESGASIWAELLSCADLPDSRKPIVKTTLYSLVFGMSSRGLRSQLLEGTAIAEGVSSEAANRILHHPLMADLMAAQKTQMEKIKKTGGMEDAFGRWVSVKHDGLKKRRGKSRGAASVMAACVQSYELRLMLPLVPIFEKETQISVLTWLHDGVTLHLGNKTKRVRHIRQIQESVAREAAVLGVSTQMEVERLPDNMDFFWKRLRREA